MRKKNSGKEEVGKKSSLFCFLFFCFVLFFFPLIFVVFVCKIGDDVPLLATPARSNLFERDDSGFVISPEFCFVFFLFSLFFTPFSFSGLRQ